MSEHDTEGMVSGPDGTILRFFYDTAKNDKATEAEGRPIFDTVLFVDVITPGQKASTPRFELERAWAEQSLKHLNLTSPVRQSHRYKEYREQIERFKSDEQRADMAGTPLKQWPRIDRGLAAALAAVNVYTVEQLASINDQNLTYLGMGGRELRESARAFLQASDTAQAERLAGTVESQRVELERMQGSLAEAHSMMAALKEQMATMTAAQSNALAPALPPSEEPPAIESTVGGKGGKATLKPLV